MHFVRIPSAAIINGGSEIRSHGERGSFFWSSRVSLSLSYPTKYHARYAHQTAGKHPADPTDT